MKNTRKIKFTTTESKTRLTVGKTCYQGQLRHNDILSEEETKKLFAQHCGEQESRTTRYVDALSEFIAHCVENGYHVDFGSFAVGLRFRGGLKSANAPFDPKVNAITVEMTPGKKIRRAVESLKPVNVTEERNWYLGAVHQDTPYAIYDQIDPVGPRQVTLVGRMPVIDPTRPDEGFWIENDAGERLLDAEVVKSNVGHAICTLTGSLPPGDHWAVLQGRDRDSPNLIRVTRRVFVPRGNI